MARKIEITAGRRRIRIDAGEPVEKDERRAMISEINEVLPLLNAESVDQIYQLTMTLSHRLVNDIKYANKQFEQILRNV